MENILVVTIIALILGCAVFYIRREKKKGVQCIGCPDSATCPGNCKGCSGNCSGHANQNQTH